MKKFIFLVVLFFVLPFLGGCGIALVEGARMIQLGMEHPELTKKGVDLAKKGVNSLSSGEIETPSLLGGFSKLAGKIGEVLGKGFDALTGADKRAKIRRPRPPAEFFVRIKPRKRKIRFAGKNHRVWDRDDPFPPDAEPVDESPPAKRLPATVGTAI